MKPSKALEQVLKKEMEKKIKTKNKKEKIKHFARKSGSQGSSGEIAEKATRVTSSRPHSLAPG